MAALQALPLYKTSEGGFFKFFRQLSILLVLKMSSIFLFLQISAIFLFLLISAILFFIFVYLSEFFMSQRQLADKIAVRKGDIWHL